MGTLHASLFAAMLYAGAFAAQDSTPLFYVERSTNGNVVHYDANLNPDNTINTDDPVRVYWTLGAIDGPQKNLGFFERRAWGVEVEPLPTAGYLMRIVSRKEMPIEIHSEPTGRVRAVTSISGIRAFLHRVYTEITGPRMFPNVRYIELFGTDAVTGADVYEKIIP